MDEARITFFRRLIASPSPSGFEQAAQRVVREEVRQYADDVRTDVHGNVLATLNSSGKPRVMLTAHCDELGFLIRYINEDGFLYFTPIGGFDPATLPGSRVHIHAPGGPILGVIGSQAVHLMPADERGRVPKLEDMWIDIGATSREEAMELVPPGTPATRAIELEPLRHDLVVSRALDDKAGVFSIIEALRKLHERRNQLKASVCLVSAVQEEVGSRGVQTSAYSVNPDIALAVDVTFTSDHPETSKIRLGDVKLGGGPGITIGGFVNAPVYQRLMNVAKEAGIPYQYDIQSSHTGTDNDDLQVSRGGVATGLLNIPLRYMHTGSEIISLSDIETTSELMARFVLSLDENFSVIP